jgi:hypothetical protein
MLNSVAGSPVAESRRFRMKARMLGRLAAVSAVATYLVVNASDALAMVARARTSSDRRLKTDIARVPSALESLRRLDPRA